MSKYPINILLKSIKIYLNPLNIMKTPIESHVWLERPLLWKRDSESIGPLASGRDITCTASKKKTGKKSGSTEWFL